MKRFGLIGSPIGHSLSPQLFRAGYPLSADTYDLIERETFEEAVSEFKSHYDAINVTAPYKEKAFLIADSTDSRTNILRATNLLVKENDGIKAYNTDCTAVEELLQKTAAGLGRIPRVLVTGCGGAGKAAALASSILNFPTGVANRDFRKAQEFCRTSEWMEPLHLDSGEMSGYGFDILVHTLPLVTSDILSLDLREKTVIEANYRNPGLSPHEKEPAYKYVPGTEWLVGQAASGFRIMTGQFPDMQNLSEFRAHL